MRVCPTRKLHSKTCQLIWFGVDLPEWLTSAHSDQVFPDAGSNAAVISLQNGPVVEGDVKVMFESSAVSAFAVFQLRKKNKLKKPLLQMCDALLLSQPGASKRI